MPTHECKYCEYKSTKKCNVDRHCISKHSNEVLKTLNITSIPQNVNAIPQNVHAIPQNVHAIPQNVHVIPQTINPINITKYNCIKCNKNFRDAFNLKRHINHCRGDLDNNECNFCHKIFSSRQSLCNHNKICNVGLDEQHIDNGHLQPYSVVSEPTQPSHVTNSVQNANTIQNAQSIQNNTTINILTFPDSIEDDSFNFNTSHITTKHLRRITRNVRPEISFSKFAVLTLEQPENRMVRKTGPNVNYSMVHVGNGIWELIIDEYIYPTIIHFLTCGALKIIEDNPELRNLIEPFRSFVDHINTDNESSQYKHAEANVKLLVINLTKRKQETVT